MYGDTNGTLYSPNNSKFLGSIWDDLGKVGEKVGVIAQGLQNLSKAGTAVQSGDARVAVVPTTQGAYNYTRSGVTNNLPMVAILGGGALLALFLATRSQPRTRRYRRR